MKRYWIATVSLGVLALVWAGCTSTHTVQNIRPEEITTEGNVVFVRPPIHTTFGSGSLGEYLRVTHDVARRNEAGLLTVNVGLRNIGGAHFWATHGPDFPISIKTAFYEQPYKQANGTTSVAVYETNWETVKMLRGDTVEYKAVCPVKAAAYYQVTVSELVGTSSPQR